LTVGARTLVATREAESPETSLDLPPEERTGLVPPLPDEH